LPRLRAVGPLAPVASPLLGDDQLVPVFGRLT
jgi:hypothetical protein